LLWDLVTTYVLDFPKISIPNRASAVKFATNPTVSFPLKGYQSKHNEEIENVAKNEMVE
jgi:hypothetical protein